MYKEYDVVRSVHDLEKVPKDARGTILLVYENSTGYEVEFVDSSGNTLNILTVSEDDIELADT